MPRTPQEAEIDRPEEEEENQVTRPSDLGFPSAQAPVPRHREIEVEALNDPPPQIDASGFVEVRMAETIEEFTYGNPHYTYRLDAGKRYRLPLEVARYLNGLGKIYQRGM